VNFLNNYEQDARITPLLLVWQATQIGDLCAEIVNEMWEDNKEDEQVQAFKRKRIEDAFSKAMKDIAKNLENVDFTALTTETN
jgi:hypothetical protein